MRPRIRRHAGTALAAAVLLLTTACGGGNNPTPTGEPSDGGGGQTSTSTEDGSGGEGSGDGQTQAAAKCPEGAPLPDGSNTHGAVTVDASNVDMEAGDQFFAPTCLTGVSQGALTVTVENTGQALHNIKIEEQGIDKDVEPGETITVDVEVGSEPVAFTCKYHSTLGMNGAIVPQS